MRRMIAIKVKKKKSIVSYFQHLNQRIFIYITSSLPQKIFLTNFSLFYKKSLHFNFLRYQFYYCINPAHFILNN